MNAVIPGESGISSTPRRLGHPSTAVEYWITRLRG
jgi:hypothetical protein